MDTTGASVAASASPTVLTFSQQLPVGFSFAANDVTACDAAGSTSSVLSSDSRTLTCTLSFPPGSSVSGGIPITVNVLRAVANGTQLQPTLSITETGQQPVLHTPPAITVVSAPRIDLVKTQNIAEQGAAVYNGQSGYILRTTVRMQQTATISGKGIAPLQAPFTIHDALSALSLNAVVIGYHGTSSTSCAETDGDGQFLPPITCSQTGTDVTLTITGPPSWGWQGYPPYAFDTGVTYIAGFQYYVFVPRSDIPVSDAGVDITDQLSGFDPSSSAGQSNFGTGYEPGGKPGDTCRTYAGQATPQTPNNNCATVHLTNSATGGGGGFGGVKDVYLKTTAPCSSSNQQLCGSTAAESGVVTPGTSILDRIYVSSGPSFFDYHRVAVCDKWDPTAQEISSDPFVASAAGTSLSAADFTMQYTNRSYADDVARKAGGCGIPGDNATDGPWYSSALAAGGASAVTAVRLFLTDPNATIPAGKTLYLDVFFTVTGQALPKPFHTADFVSARWDGSTGGSADSGTVFMDRDGYIITDELLMLQKSASRGVGGPALVAAPPGTTVTWSLQAQLLVNGSTTDTLTVVDTLPGCFTNVTFPDATTNSLWSHTVTGGGASPGQACGPTDPATVVTFTSILPMPANVVHQIYFNSDVAITAADNMQLSNQAKLTAPNTTMVAPAAATITVRAASEIRVSKLAIAPLVEVAPDGIGYTVQWVNSSAVDAGKTQWIDLLPYLGDGRGSVLHGTFNLTSVTSAGAALAIIEYTSAASPSVDSDPAAASNGASGATRWCTLAQLGAPGCPAAIGAVTAVRATVANLFAGAIGGLTIHASPIGNHGGDKYGNNLGLGRAANIALPLPVTQTAEINVVSSTIGNFVWADLNGNGRQDAGEPGISGFTVHLIDPATNTVLATTSTDSQGHYQFGNLHSGSHIVGFDPASLGVGRQFTARQQGSDPALDSDGDPGTGRTAAFTIGANTVEDGIDQGVLLRPIVGLAFTGASPIGYLGGGIVLAGTGLALYFFGRRRRAPIVN